MKTYLMYNILQLVSLLVSILPFIEDLFQVIALALAITVSIFRLKDRFKKKVRK